MEFFLEAFNSGALAGREDKTDAPGPNVGVCGLPLALAPYCRWKTRALLILGAMTWDLTPQQP